MVRLSEVSLGTRPLQQFSQVLPSREMRAALATSAHTRERLAGRVVWQVNSTAVGGGVAEMLLPLLSYARSVGIDARWVVIQGDTEFFRITKRLHHALHGSPGDGSELGEAEHERYQATLRENALELCSLVRPRDVVILHDPQTAGLAPLLLDSGAIVIWRCHIGHDDTNEELERGWKWLRRYLEQVPSFVFSRRSYVPEYCDHGRSDVITPSIDAFSPKNQELDDTTVRSILVHTGLLEGPGPDDPNLLFWCVDGTPCRVGRRAEVVRLGRPPSGETPLVVQVSRWDPLKDPIGVMQGFAELVNGRAPGDAELVLAGPNPEGVTDDPEGAEIYAKVVSHWRELPEAIRGRIHLACLPTADVGENAAIVNALQRHARVVVQKSLQEGFGLTVTEAMWKARPVVASAVGGIQDQIEDGVSGVLLANPTNIEGFASALGGVLADPPRAKAMGEAARERVREHFLGVNHLLKYARLIERLDEATDQVRNELE
jgi:trehalose synthase